VKVVNIGSIIICV